MTTPSTAKLAQQLFRAGHWADAARVARLAAQQDPASAEECAAVFGISSLRLGRNAEARTALEFALAKNPRSVTLRLAFAEAALATGDDLACERALDELAVETVDADELRAGLRRAQCELPAINTLTDVRAAQRTTPGQWESAMGLLLELGLVDDAERLVQRPPAGTLPDCVRLMGARMATARGDVSAATSAWQRVLEQDPAHRSEAFDAMVALNAIDEATELARAIHADTGDPAWLARSALYAGRVDDALALLAPAAPSASHAVVSASVAVLQGRPEEAVRMLAPVERGPSEALLHVEALRRAGRFSDAMEALRALTAAQVAEVAAAPLCHIAVHASCKALDRENEEWLLALRADFPDVAAGHPDAVAFATVAIDSLSGNWSGCATRPDHEGRPRRQSISRSVRQRVAMLRGALRGFPLPSVIERLEALEAQHGPHPLIATYGAELLLWWGDYPRAEAWLSRALALDEQARWAYVGRATLENVTGRPEAALATIARQRELMPPLANSLACTAEAHLRLGDPASARTDYEAAIAAHPTRVSAWLGLAAAQLALGEPHLASLERVQQLTPVFFRQWQREVTGRPAREQTDHAFAMLLGNRGSDLITWRTRDGKFHGENAVR